MALSSYLWSSAVPSTVIFSPFCGYPQVSLPWLSVLICSYPWSLLQSFLWLPTGIYNPFCSYLWLSMVICSPFCRSLQSILWVSLVPSTVIHSPFHNYPQSFPWLSACLYGSIPHSHFHGSSRILIGWYSPPQPIGSMVLKNLMNIKSSLFPHHYLDICNVNLKYTLWNLKP